MSEDTAVAKMVATMLADAIYRAGYALCKDEMRALVDEDVALVAIAREYNALASGQPVPVDDEAEAFRDAWQQGYAAGESDTRRALAREGGEEIGVEAVLSSLRSHMFPACPACGAAVDDPEAYDGACDQHLLVPIRAAAKAYSEAAALRPTQEEVR